MIFSSITTSSNFAWMAKRYRQFDGFGQSMNLLYRKNGGSEGIEIASSNSKVCNNIGEVGADTGGFLKAVDGLGNMGAGTIVNSAEAVAYL